MARTRTSEGARLLEALQRRARDAKEITMTPSVREKAASLAIASAALIAQEALDFIMAGLTLAAGAHEGEITIDSEEVEGPGQVYRHSIYCGDVLVGEIELAGATEDSNYLTTGVRIALYRSSLSIERRQGSN